MGLYGSYTNSTISSQQANVWGGNLSYIAIGVPTKNQISQFIDKKKSPYSWGLGFSLQPYSSVGYDISINDSSDTTLGTINHRFQGGGGAYRLMMSNGVKYKNFALGCGLGQSSVKLMSPIFFLIATKPTPTLIMTIHSMI